MNALQTREKGRAHPFSREEQIANLERLKAKKQERMRMMLLRSRKKGQVKTIRYFSHLITIEIRKEEPEESKSLRNFARLLSLQMEKEQRELEVINEELRTLKSEINTLHNQYGHRA